MSLDFRREVAIVVDDATAIADVQQLFGAINALPTEGRADTADAPGEALC